MSKRRKKKEKDIYEDYEPDGRDLAAHLRSEEEFMKENPDFDPADYLAQQQSDIERGK